MHARATAVPVFCMHAAALACVPVLLVLVLFTRYFSDLSQLNLDTINVKILE